MTEWPRWATEPVRVVKPDDAWRRRGEQECRRLGRRLAGWLLAPVEHVGSTAVPGLPAKPILDLQAAVADLSCADAVAAALLPGGWHYLPPELDGLPWRRFFVRVAGGQRVAHLQMVALTGDCWRAQLVFRDALRADPALARDYAQLKRSLASRHRHQREKYTAGKADFIAAVLGKYGGDSALAVVAPEP